MAYRAPPVVGREVDESLFGETAARKVFNSKTYEGAVSYSPQGRTKVGGGRSGRVGGAAVAAAAPLTVASGEVVAMRREATLGNGEAVRAAEERRAAAEERTAVAEARKERIRALEASRLANVPLSQLQQEEEDEKNARRALAVALREQATDDMKAMNSIINEAITVSIRDRQMEEKRRQREAEKAAQRMMELKAEIEVMESQQRADEAEGRKRAGIKVQQRALAEQLGAAIHRKRAALEAVQAEERVRRERMKEELAEEEAGKVAALHARKALLADFKLHNDAAVEARAGRKAAEREAEARADAEALVLAEKKEAQLRREEEARKEKERILHLAATNVASILDDRDARDELRARRAQELADRAVRAKALREAQSKAASQAALRAAAEGMKADKLAAMAGMIEEEKREFEKAARAQAEWLEREREAERERARKGAALLKDLGAQVEEKRRAEAGRKAAEAKEEAERVAGLKEQVRFLKAIRDKQVGEIQALGVAPQWTSALMKYDTEAISERKEMSGRPPIVKAEGVVGPGWKK
jgi:hypothetical protein